MTPTELNYEFIKLRTFRRHGFSSATSLQKAEVEDIPEGTITIEISATLFAKLIRADYRDSNK